MFWTEANTYTGLFKLKNTINFSPEVKMINYLVSVEECLQAFITRVYQTTNIPRAVLEQHWLDIVNPQRKNYPEDSVINFKDRVEWADDGSDWGCQYFYTKGPKAHMFCMEKTIVNKQFCPRHKKYIGTKERVEEPSSDTYQDIHVPWCRKHAFLGHYWFPRLLLGATHTSEGPVVIGRVMGNRWYKELSQREIERCHNVGLLYKVVPQELLHHTYDVPHINLDELDTEGFLSYDQIRRERPSLYLKYWKIWNLHIQDRKDFYKKWKKNTKERWNKVNKYSPVPDWDKFCHHYSFRGLENKIVPSPTIDMIRHSDFNPWVYMDSFREKFDDILIPPYFIDYPIPEQYRQRPFPASQKKIDQKDLESNPSRVRHIRKWPAQAFISYLEKGHEWGYLLNY